MKRLELGNHRISKNHISYLELYCSEKAKLITEKGKNITKFLDRISKINIRTDKDKEIEPIFYNTLIERTHFYGIDDDYFANNIIVSALTDIIKKELYSLYFPSLLKRFYNPNKNVIELELEFEPKIALEITKSVRDFLPRELIKEVETFISNH